MSFVTFDLERGQSLWENVVEFNLSESGVHPLSLRELEGFGLDLDEILETPLAYVQTNGTPELRGAIAELYPGSTADGIEVVNGTSEANYLAAGLLMEDGGGLLAEVPNYLQVAGLARNLGVEVATFPLRPDEGWRPDWEAFEKGLADAPRLVYVSHPNNPTGYILDDDEQQRIVAGVERAGAWLLADEVYRGAELNGVESASFWGRSDRVLVTSGLSKAYGLPGARIGWIVTSEAIAGACWARHDYTTIAPGALSDRIARFAVRPEIRTRLFERARSYMVPNRDLFQEWVASQQGRVSYRAPEAGAYAFVSYHLPISSVALCDRLRQVHDVLVVPGTWMGMEGTVRIGLGTPRAVLQAGLERLGNLLEELDR